MITIEFSEAEYYDDENNEFVVFPAKVVDFEFSLKAMYDWEAKHKVPFLNCGFTGMRPELLDFYLMMSSDKTLTVEYFNTKTTELLYDYLNQTTTGTTFSQNGNRLNGRGKIYTAEEIYALMFMNHIDIEFENRNLNRLLVILRIISLYNTPPEKMSNREVMAQNAKLNAERRAQYKTKG